jgi:hypothetical protein
MVFDLYLIKYLSRTFLHPTFRNAPCPSPASPQLSWDCSGGRPVPILSLLRGGDSYWLGCETVRRAGRHTQLSSACFCVLAVDVPRETPSGVLQRVLTSSDLKVKTTRALVSLIVSVRLVLDKTFFQKVCRILM